MMPFVDPGLGSTCMYIIGGLCGAVVGLAGYIVKLHITMNGIQESRVKWMADQLALMRTLADEFHKPPDKPKGGRP